MFENGRVQEAMAELTGLAGRCAASPMWALSQAELLEFVDSVHSAQQMLYVALLHAIQEIDGRSIPVEQGASSTKVWLRDRLRVSPATALRMLVQADVLDADPELDATVSSGAVNAEQLAAITATLTELPDGLGQEIRGRAGATLADWAARLDPIALRTAGRRILDHVAPEVAEATEEARLRRAEAEAHRQRYFTLNRIGDGRVRVRGILDSEAAAVVSAALDPLCTPDSAASEAAHTGEVRTPGQRRADALTEVCRLVLAGADLPDNGGDRPQVAITVPYDVLRKELRSGRLDTGEPVSAETVRRMCCDARILPIVLNTDGGVLDAGRTRRVASGTMRHALVARDQGCVFPGCDRPSRWCDAHHIVAWADGGSTSLANLAMLCGHHHRLVHSDSGWTLRIGADGHPEFLPPVWLDPDRVPRRNEYHRRI